MNFYPFLLLVLIPTFFIQTTSNASMVFTFIDRAGIRYTVLFLTVFVSIVFTSTQSHADVSKVRNYYPFSDAVLTSGQPEKNQLERASEEGIEVVINIVPSTESIYLPQEEEILSKQGIEYFHTPVNWRAPTDNEIERFLAAMDRVGDRKVLVHCWANARASALVHIHQMRQSSDNSAAEYERLKKVWDDIAGYNLQKNKIWNKVIKDYAVEVHSSD